MKTNEPKKVASSQNTLLRLAQRNYLIGNFYQVRRIVGGLLAKPNLSNDEKMQCLALRRLTGIDKLAFSIGFLCIILIATAAMITRY